MASSIVAYDIEGSSYTGFKSGNYKQERAVRRFLVNGGDVTDKTTVLFETLRDLRLSSNDVHPQAQYSVTSGGSDYAANLPMQTATIKKAGRRTNSDTGLLWIVEVTYFYAI